MADGVVAGLDVADGGAVGVAAELGAAGGVSVGAGVAAALGEADGVAVGAGVAAALGVAGGVPVGVSATVGLGVASGGVVGVSVAAALGVPGRRVRDVGEGVARRASSRPQASRENSVPAVAALNPRATICRMNSRRVSAISGLPPLSSLVSAGGVDHA